MPSSPPLSAPTTAPSAASAAEPGAIAGLWSGPLSRRELKRSGGRFWRRTLWSLLYPRRRERILPTVSGSLLVILSLGLGVAAYNTSNNILFITLSLLLSCLILSGLLSWLNFARVGWRVVVTPPWRVGQTTAALVEVRNEKRLLPTYGLAFDVRTRSEPKGARLVLSDRLDPGSRQRLEWAFRPTRRGRERVEVVGVASLFPFGFLRKVLTSDAHQEALVWPAAVEYQRVGLPAPARPLAGEPVARLGQSGDLLALRRYTQGDSHRQIHWKASARLRHLMVRQFASETQDAYTLWLQTPAAIWSRPEQFELLCSFAATLAEDLYKTGRLGVVALNEEPARPVRRLRDLETFLDALALLTPVDQAASGRTLAARHHLLTFGPEGARGVNAFVDGQKAATA